jgi:prepilin-type N-terminal cleavage/methylation domain-containing protein
MMSHHQISRPSGSQRPADGGFTLVEIVISMTLLAIIFTAAFGSHFLAMRMIEDSRDQVRASQIIQSELEAMRTMNWSDLEALPAKDSFSPRGQFVQVFADRYTASREVIDLSSTQKEVIIRVEWKQRGKPYFQIFNTVFTRNGLNDYNYRAI